MSKFCFNLCLTLCVFAGNLTTAIELTDVIQVTEIYEDIQFARNTQGSIDKDSEGNVHLVYFIPGSGSVPENKIYHQVISNAATQSLNRVDNDSLDAIHPAMIVDHSDNVHIVWHDRRNSTAAGNFFDNIEIYYDYQSSDKSFAAQDTRITQSNADHQGDNSYLPLILQTQDLKLHIIWYDFYLDGSVADVYLYSSDENGSFSTILNLEQHKITEASQNDQNSVWMPTFAETSPNHIYFIYGQKETFTEPFELKGLEIAPDGTQTPVETVAVTGSSFFDPARLASDDQGNLGLVYQSRIDGINQIVFQYKALNESWSEPLILSTEDIHASQPDIDFDSIGNAHIVWQEDTGLGWYSMINPLEFEVVDHESFSNPIEFVLQPVITVDQSNNQKHIAWVSEVDLDQKAIFMVSSLETNVTHWQLF